MPMPGVSWSIDIVKKSKKCKELQIFFELFNTNLHMYSRIHVNFASNIYWEHFAKRFILIYIKTVCAKVINWHPFATTKTAKCHRTKFVMIKLMTQQNHIHIVISENITLTSINYESFLSKLISVNLTLYLFEVYCVLTFCSNL